MVICQQLLLVVINSRKGFWRAKLPRFNTKPSNFCNIHIVIKSNLVPRASFPLTSGRKTRALGATISGMRHRCRCAVSRITRIRLFPLFFHNGCSQSSRFPTAGQGERSSGNEIALNLNLIRHWSENWCPGYLKHALSSSEIHFALAKSLEIIGHVTNCCKRYYAKNGRLIPTAKRGKEIKQR